MTIEVEGLTFSSYFFKALDSKKVTRIRSSAIILSFLMLDSISAGISTLELELLVSHFAYNIAFGIPFIPFKTSVFNQTSVIWSLFWGLIALVINDCSKLKKWQKTVLILGILAISFCADWSCIAVLAIMEISTNRGNFKKQMTGMMIWCVMYAVIYFIFINPVYGVIQLFVALNIPLLKLYNGQRGAWKGMKYLFYVYYPLHLVICGIIRIVLHGNISVMIGG